MKEISKQQVEELAKLARLGLTEKEKLSLAKEMTAILNYARMLDEVDTKNVQPTSQVTSLDNVLRKDEFTPSDIPIEEKLRNAPAREKTFIRVKKVLE
jgi:aspartyl-tRNA(Asn)/glutamyl-tRNA(Gln) amidotransferase subunit C